MRWRRGCRRPRWLLLAALIAAPACGTDAEEAEQPGDPGDAVAEDTGEPAAEPPSGAVDVESLPGYRESRARLDEAQAMARRHPLTEWQDLMAILDDTPLRQARVARAVSLTLISLPQRGVDSIAKSSMADRDAGELSIHLTRRGLEFARIHRDPDAVVPLIERLAVDEGRGNFANHWFELTQMALVAITGETEAPRYSIALPERRRAAQEYWATWWRENARGFSPADEARGDRALRRWMNRRPSRGTP